MKDFKTNTIPHNIEAEQGLIGCLLVDNKGVFDIIDTVKPTDFFYASHASIFEKIKEKVDAGENASPVTLKNFFQDHPDLKDVGGADYLAHLAGEIFSVVNLKDYAALIVDLAERRRLIQGLEALTDELRYSNYQARPALEIASDIMAMAQKNDRGDFVKTSAETRNRMLREFQLPHSFDLTGLEGLDSAMAGGLYGGFTYGFAGAEKRGKTTLAGTISYNLNESGVKHAYVALEMGSLQIESRNIARRIGVNPIAFLYRNKTAIQKAAQEAPVMPNNCFYLDMPGCTLDDLKSQIMGLVMKHQIKGFILDYWQLVGGVQRGQSTAEHLYDVAQWCANFSRKHGIWCILLSQLNRQGETFGSAGIDKACDQLYSIEEAADKNLWLSMRRSRYTALTDVGDADAGRYRINDKGPFFEEIF